ncbi:hypothetical protein [Brumimicrobium mesophilum]|uniref:hypothetical protein n=1 Tax=Brumimicrobium mesophilum TaxID=392717 RepID=UPI000D13F57E|nr:hypothetical protein [Brumimicrobium mesophilum]
MKKLLFGAVLVGCLGLTSCKKDYTCTYSGNGGIASGSTDFSTKDKSEAEDFEKECKAAGGTWRTN